MAVLLLQGDPRLPGGDVVRAATAADLTASFRQLDIPARVVETPSEGTATGVVERFTGSLLDAGASHEAIVVVDARLVAHTSALRALACDDRLTRGVLVRRMTDDDLDQGVRIDRGVVVAAASPVHRSVAGTHASVGAIRLTGSDVPELVARLDDVRTGIGDAALASALRRAPIAVLTTMALAAGLRLSAVDIRGMVAEVARSSTQVEAAMAHRREVAEDRAWLDAAVKARDGFFTTYLVSPYSRFLARWAARRGLTPNQVTATSMAVGAVAAGAFAWGARWSAILGALALQLSFTLDCVDGQLSRYTQRFTAFGAWLDSTFDRGKEALVYTGLAIWGARTGDTAIWGLAATTLAFQTVRHSLDSAFGANRPPPTPHPPAVADGADPDDGTTGSSADLGRVLRAASHAERAPILRWGKRMIVFPIGERFAVISVAAVVATPRLTFLILIAWGLVAACYSLLGRLLRSRRWVAPVRWLAEPSARALEYGVILALGLLVADAAGVATYAALGALVTREYDRIHRAKSLGRESLRTTAARFVPPWPVRVAGLAVAAGAGVLEPVLWGLAGLVGVVTVVDVVSVWRRAGIRTADADAADEEDD